MPLPRRNQPKRLRQDSLLKNGVGFLLLTAAAVLPANPAFAQSPQQDYLRQQADALKAQMARVQIEQAADPSFAAKAYQAQQAYLQDTAEKSFRIGKPQTAKSHLVSGQADSYQAPPAMPPVHVAPDAYSVPPQRMAQRIAPPPVQYSTPAQHSAYVNPTQPAPAPPQGYPTRALPPRTIAEIPSPAELGDQGESISGPANRVGLQDRLTGLLSQTAQHSKQRLASKLPIPAFKSEIQNFQDQGVATPAKRPPATQQPLFSPEPRSLDMAELPPPSVSRIDEAAYERMAAAIAEREVDQAVAYEENLSDSDVVQVALAVPVPQNMGFMPPPRQQQSSVPTFNAPATKAPARRSTRPTAAKQISVLALPTQEDDDSNAFGLRQNDDDSALIDRLRTQRDEELPRPQAGSSLEMEPLRRPEPSPVDDEKEQLEQRLRELDQETERRETKRRQRELEREEEQSKLRSLREDQGEVRSNADETERDTRPLRESCDDFRRNLLGSSIREISMDMSPRASRIRDQYIAISRSWTDRLGNVVATGSMVDLRRGYVIIDGNGGRQKIPYSKLSDADSAAVSEYWQIPSLCSTGDNRLPQRHWVPQSFTWTASSLCHKPLYFENQQLERYGHTHGPVLQPFQSAAHFFVSLATLPYQSAIHPPTECRYALGYYRPGNCAPWLKDPIPISLEGLSRQAVVTTGLSFIP